MREAGGPEAGGTLVAHVRKQLAGSGRRFALEARFRAEPGFTILFGPSGAGKTTLLDCIAGLVRPDSGQVILGDRVLFDSINGLPTEHRRIGYVFQDLALFPHLSVEKNIQYGLRHLSARERSRRIQEMLARLRITHLRERRPDEISGGERQRVALARALVTDPCLLLLDEPLAGLDGPTKSALIEDLRTWNRAHRVPILYVTHSREEVFALGERVLVLDNGQIIADGTPHEVMSAPRHETVAQLAGFENVFEVTIVAPHPDRGTMTCQIAGTGMALETPLVRAQAGSRLRVGIRAGDILLAAVPPSGLSARNVLPGKLTSLEQRDVIITATIECGVPWKVLLTLAARDSLKLAPGSDVWLIVKTHSCYLMAE